MADTTPPTIAITSSNTKLKAGETALITFTLSEAATDFVVSDIVFTGSGTLTGFSGSGSNYSAVFTPAPTGEGSSVVSVGNFKFSDAAGNANEDGADANNRLELTYDTVPPKITITSNKNHLGLGENAAVTFTLSEPSTDFTIEDITTTYGTLTGFSGSGKTYTATFVPSGVDVGLITVNGYRFSDSFGNQNDQSTQLLITPFDPSRGNVQWTRLLESSSYVEALTTGTDGAIYMAGYTEGSLDGQTNSGNHDAFLTKYDANGNKAWTRLLGTSSSAGASALTTGIDGAIYMAGQTGGNLDGQTNSGGSDAFLTKYDANGTKVWTRLLGSSSNETATALTTGADGAIYMAGYTSGSLDGQINSGSNDSYTSDAFLTKYDTDGTKAWTRLLGTNSFDSAPELTTGTDGAIYMAGWTFGSLDGQTNSGMSDAFLIKYNPDGTKAWTKLLGTSSDDHATALTTGSDGAIYMAGYTWGSLDGQTNSSGYMDAFLTKDDANGSKAWTRQLGTIEYDFVSSLTTGTDGAIYMAGWTFGSLDGQTNSGLSDAFITKYNPDGTKAWTRLLGTSWYESARSLTTGTDGAIYMAGYTGGNLDGQTNSGGGDAFLTKFVVPETAVPTITLQADKTSVAAGGSVAITFTLSKPSTNFIASDVTVVDGVLSNFSGSGTTYTATFTPLLGSATAALSVGSGKFSDALGNFNEDGAETNNTVTISISGSTPPTIQFSTTSSSASEGNSGTTTVTVQATLSAASAQAVTVPISYSGTATSGTDYSSATASITIAAGQTTGSASFSVIGGTTLESNETVILTMGTPTNATLGANTSYTHTITNDDLKVIALSGVVIDGYVAGATIYLDANGNGVAESWEKTTLTTDAQGRFSGTVVGEGALIAVGGINTDTGLTNGLTLSAPSGSGVISPLTTLVQAVVRTNKLSAADASAAVSQVLGLPGSVDLLSFDPLAVPQDSAAVAVQKANVQVALTAALGGEGVVDKVAGAIGGLNASGKRLDLSDALVLGTIAPEVSAGVIQSISGANAEVKAAGSMAQLAATQKTALVAAGRAGSEGDDSLSGVMGDERIDGGEGIDTATYISRRENYTLSRGSDGNWTVSFSGPIITIFPAPPTEGTDTLVGVERLKFSDTSLALDVEGNAGTTAKILGAVFGKAAVANKAYAGIGLHYLDNLGYGYEQLMELAINAALGPTLTHGQVVDLLYKNVVGVLPDAATKAMFVGMLDRKEQTSGSLGVLAAETDLNKTNIDLVGLAKTGLEYLPFQS